MLPRVAPRVADTASGHRLVRRLRMMLRGTVATDAGTLAREGRLGDTGLTEPVCVVMPADEADLLLAIEIAAEAGVPIRARGAGSHALRDLSRAVLLDFSQSLHAVTGFEQASGLVEVQAGISLARLDAWLAAHDRCLGVDLPGAGHASAGAMIAGNVVLRGGGRIIDRVEAIDAVLVDGVSQRFGPFGVDGSDMLRSARASHLVSSLFELTARESVLIGRAWPRACDPALGPRLDLFGATAAHHRSGDGSVNLAHLLVGSRGTCALSRRIRLRTIARARRHARVAVLAPTLDAALACVTGLRESALATIDLFDRGSIDSAARAMPLGHLAGAWVRRAQAMLLVGIDSPDEHPRDCEQRCAVLRDFAMSAGCVACVFADRDTARIDAWRERELRLLEQGDTLRVLRFAADNRFPLERLSEARRRLQVLCDTRGLSVRWFGAVGAGVLSMRPAGERRQIDPEFADAVHAIVVDCGGALDGHMLAPSMRDPLLAVQFGDALAGLCREARRLFDPHDRLVASAQAPAAAPAARRAAGTAWDGELMSLTELRLAVQARGPGGAPGSDCPSYRASRREIDSPRGRIATLRAALDGRLGADGLASPELAAAFAGCVGCGACREEPSMIDLARVRVELLAHARARRGTPWHASLLARLPERANRLAWLTPLIRARNALPWLAALLDRASGLARARRWPLWRHEGFRERWRKAPGQPRESAGDPVVLWVDTFNDRISPHVLEAATRVLEAAGYRIVLVSPGSDEGSRRGLCCARLAFDQGQLALARDEAARSLRALAPALRDGLRIVVLEPSCLSMMRDEYRALWRGDDSADGRQLGALAQRLGAQVLSFEQCLAEAIANDRLAVAPALADAPVLHVQAHCQDRPPRASAASVLCQVLEQLSGMRVERLDRGCCGMGPLSGFESAHDSASSAILRVGLLADPPPADRPVRYVANGFGCRCQIADVGGLRVEHAAELIDRMLGESVPARPPQKPAAAPS